MVYIFKYINNRKVLNTLNTLKVKKRLNKILSGEKEKNSNKLIPLFFY